MPTKRPLASDEALGLSGYTAASADADDVADVADAASASASPQSSVILAKPVQSYEALNGKMYGNYDEALVHSYEFLINQQIKTQVNLDLREAVELLYNYPYIVNLMAERNKAWLSWDEACKLKAKGESDNG